MLKFLGAILKRAPSTAPSVLRSCLCTEDTLMRDDFQDWAERVGEARRHLHRKVWEWCFVCQALDERGLLTAGRRGLGFAVGQEPLPAVFANRGVQILATDLARDQAADQGWVQTDQHAGGQASIYNPGLCPPDKLHELVRFRIADMNALTPDLGSEFDFLWSACAFEHLGSIERGKDFVVNAMRHLRPGGVAVHTTEFNVSSNRDTVIEGPTALYRRRDIQDLVNRLRDEGHDIDVDFNAGKSPADKYIDVPPYTHATHIKLQIEKYVVTSIGLIITKKA